jgi:hypothetical protein
MSAPAPPRQDAARHWLVILLFLAGLLAADAAVEFRRDVWHRYNPDDYREKLLGCRREPRDLVVVGGSPVAEGIDPTAFTGMAWHGRPVCSPYAMGLPGGTTTEFWHALKHGAVRAPRVLVYGIAATDLNDKRNEPHGPASLMTWDDLGEWVASRPNSAEWAARHYLQGRLNRAWRLFHHRNGIRLWAADHVERLWPGTCPRAAEEAHEAAVYSDALRAGRGYAPNVHFVNRRYDERKAAGFKEPDMYQMVGYRLGEHLAYLHRMLDWADTRGTCVVLVDMPVTADMEARYPKEFAAYRAALAEVVRTRRVIFLDASRGNVGLDDRHFADLIHLNGDGAARLSAWVRRRLETPG